MFRIPRLVTGCLRSRLDAVNGIKPTCRNSSGKALPARTKVNEDDIEEAFLKGSGPGGQKINKTASAVQLKHKPTGMVVKVQDTRSRDQNRKIARARLGEKLQFLEKGEESRMAIKAKAAAKKKASASKKTRRKYRALGETETEAKKSTESDPSEAKEQPGAGPSSSSS